MISLTVFTGKSLHVFITGVLENGREFFTVQLLEGAVWLHIGYNVA